jgi:hypothetical protein
MSYSSCVEGQTAANLFSSVASYKELPRMNALWSVLRFNRLCLAVSILYAALFGLLLFSPESLTLDLGIADSATATFFARRAAMLMAGFAVLTFLGRNVREPSAKRSICGSVFVSMIGLAATGVHAFQTGFVGRGIVLPILIESAFGVLFLLVLLAERKTPAA